MRTAALLSSLTALTACSSTPREVAPIDGPAAPFLNHARLELTDGFGHGRFPNVVVTPRGTVLASFGAGGVAVRRSEDGGASFGPELLLTRSGFHGGGTTVDEVTGAVFVFVEEDHPPAPVEVFKSNDDGLSFAPTRVRVLPDSEGRVPSMHMNEHGLTLRRGPHAGRLLRASRWYGQGNDRAYWAEHFTNAIYSDDGGRTWTASEPFPERGTGEAAIVELADGTLYYNSRVHLDERPDNRRRRSALSRDGGATWVDWRLEPTLPDGRQDRSYGCMGGLTRLPIDGRDVLVFSNLDTSSARRERITVWGSFDGGRSWPVKRLVHAGDSAYSSLAAGRTGTPSEGWIYLHFEGGPVGASTLARFDLAWLLGGEPTGDGRVPTIEELRGDSSGDPSSDPGEVPAAPSSTAP